MIGLRCGRCVTARKFVRGARMLLLVVLLSLPAVARALDFTYTTSNGDVTITKYTGSGGNVTIPSTIDGLPVTSIGNSAFSNCTGLTSVTIPNSVTSIGNSAFWCTGLTSVTIPNSVTSIGYAAFYHCTGLTSVMIGNSVTSIGDQAFSNCTGLTSITIPNSVTSIVYAAFYHCTGLTSVTIGNSVTSIGDDAFSDCTGLTSVTIPNSVTSIGGGAFYHCTGLTSVTIGNSVTSIGDQAFSDCTGLTAITVDAWNLAYSSIEGVLFNKSQTSLIRHPEGKAGTSYTIPKSVTSIGNYAFFKCTGLTTVTIPNSVTSIGYRAFDLCSSLTSVTIPNSVTSIGGLAFFKCTGLTSVTIPNSVTSIVGYVFSYCTSLTSVTIPGSVTSIRDNAFASCTGLTSVTIPNSVTSIGEYAFSSCTSLTSVTIPDSVTSIGEYAFSLCTSLTSVTIPDSVTYIGDSAFVGCTGLTSITIPDCVTYIGGRAFFNCTGLDAITVDAHNHAYSSINGVLFNKSQTILVHYPAGKAGTYTIPDSVISIGEYAFASCIGLTSVTTPNSVISIGYGTFRGCTGLKGVYFLGDAPSHGSDVFKNANNVIVYYLLGTTGWGTTYCDRPTALWVLPQNTPVVTIAPTAIWNASAKILAIQATASVAGKTLTSATYFNWALTNVAGSVVAGGALTYNAATERWTASQTISGGLATGAYVMVYRVLTADGTSATRSGPLSVAGKYTLTGRVLNGDTLTPLPGVTVTVGSQSATTGMNGDYSIPGVDPSAATFVTFTLNGYSAGSNPLNPPASGIQIVQDSKLWPVSSSKPVVTNLTAEYDGMFISGVKIPNTFTATVAWGSGGAKKVDFYVNSTLTKSVTATGSDVAATIDMGSFPGSTTTGANKLRVIATDAKGAISNPFDKKLTIFPMPGLLKLGQSMGFAPVQLILGNSPALSFDITVPDSSIATSDLHQIPLIGDFGWNMAVSGGFEYELASGDWELHVGTGPFGRWAARDVKVPNHDQTKPEFNLGPVTIEASGVVKETGTATPNSGITIKSADVIGEVKCSQDLTVNLEKYIPGAQWLSILDVFKYIGADPNSLQRLIFTGSIDAQADLKAVFDPPPIKFQNAKIPITVAVEGAYRPNLVVAKASATLGGSVTGNFQLPPNPFLKNVTGILGGDFSATLLNKVLIDYPYVIAQGTLYNATLSTNRIGETKAIRLLSAEGKDTGWVVLPCKNSGLRIVSRDYLKNGKEIFVADAEQDGSRNRFSIAPSISALSPLEAFREIGQAKASAMSISAVKQAIVTQADLTLVQNIYPYSDPAMASNGTSLMLLYSADNNGTGNDLNFTDINWTRFDGTKWSTPAPILADNKGDFAPSVAFDGNGDAVALWERMRDASFNNIDDTKAMCAQLEITTARWDHATGKWAPVALTNNTYVDHSPKICGPMADGSLLAVWTTNQKNLLMGTGPDGATSNSQVQWSKWNPATHTWSGAQTLVANLAYRTSQDLAGTSVTAVYAWTRDMNRDTSTTSDQEVFYRKWNGSTWSNATRLTSDTLSDTNIHAGVTRSGNVFLTWQRDGNLVMDTDLAGQPRVIRPDSTTIAFADYSMTLGANNNLALLWQERDGSGNHTRYAAYDPAGNRWSKDQWLFSGGSALEHSFTPTWDAAGNLSVAYARSIIQMTTKTLQLEGGGTISVPNYPAQTRVDLGVVKHALTTDLGMNTGDFTVDTSAGCQPGCTVQMSATVRNLGDLPVANVVVDFYNGNPSTGGTKIATQTIPGWLDGGTVASAEATWILPLPPTSHTFYAVIAPLGSVTEINTANNQQSLTIGGVDLTGSIVSVTMLGDGSARIITNITNIGGTNAPTTTLGMRKQNTGGIALATAAVPALASGQLAQVALNLPAAKIPVGESKFTITADASAVSGDTNHANNSVNLSVMNSKNGVTWDWRVLH